MIKINMQCSRNMREIAEKMSPCCHILKSCFLFPNQIEYMEEAAFEREPGTARVSQNYVKAALSALMPVVLETLLKQDEDSADDLEHWDLGQ